MTPTTLQFISRKEVQQQYRTVLSALTLPSNECESSCAVHIQLEFTLNCAPRSRHVLCPDIVTLSLAILIAVTESHKTKTTTVDGSVKRFWHCVCGRLPVFCDLVGQNSNWRRPAYPPPSLVNILVIRNGDGVSGGNAYGESDLFNSCQYFDTCLKYSLGLFVSKSRFTVVCAAIYIEM